MGPHRVPAGIRTGGQFTANTRGEATVELPAAEPTCLVCPAPAEVHVQPMTARGPAGDGMHSCQEHRHAPEFSDFGGGWMEQQDLPHPPSLERLEVMQGWTRPGPDGEQARWELTVQLHDELAGAASRRDYSDEVTLPAGQPAFTYPHQDMVIDHATIEIGADWRPRLRIRMPRAYKTSAVITSDGATWSGEHDRMDDDDMAAIEEWLAPWLERVDAAAHTIRTHGWLDPEEYLRLSGASELYPA
ncbi:hypothetical protein [Cellulomonas hominis]|nr:hypothetical protein [Cellulomonas hominis]